jgi:hypothetical protein
VSGPRSSDLHLPWPLKHAVLRATGGRTVVCPECRQPVRRELFPDAHLLECRKAQEAASRAAAEAT